MILHRFLAALLIIALVTPSLSESQRTEPPQVWRAFAEKLEAGAFIKVTLKDHKKIKGSFVMIQDDVIRVKPHTRIPVAIRDFRFTDIESIDRQREGWSPAAKVLTGVEIGVGVVLSIGLAIALSWD